MDELLTPAQAWERLEKLVDVEYWYKQSDAAVTLKPSLLIADTLTCSMLREYGHEGGEVYITPEWKYFVRTTCGDLELIPDGGAQPAQRLTLFFR